YGFKPLPTSFVFSAAVQPDGKIVMGGNFSSVGGSFAQSVVRLNSDGNVDSGWQDPGIEYPAGRVSDLAIQADGKILLCGRFDTIGSESHTNIARLNSDGSLDHSFSPQLDAEVSSMQLQADGKILLAGGFSRISGQPCSRLGRLNLDGT